MPTSAIHSNAGLRLAVLLAAVISSAPARAADLSAVPATPQATPAPTFAQGVYSGAFVGLGGESVSARARPGGGAVSGFASGFTSGALIGYAFRDRSLVYGLEADLATQTAKRDFAARPGFHDASVDAIGGAHLRARLGYDVGAFEPFVAAGLAYGRFAVQRDAPSGDEGASRAVAGLSLGAGVETPIDLPILGPSVLRAEYLYDRMPRATFALAGGPSFSARIDEHTFRLALITREGPATSPATPFRWDGPYIGALAGWTGERVTARSPSRSTTVDASGGLGGLYSGRGWMFGPTFVGYESAIAFSGANGASGALRYRDWIDADLRGRIGYPLGGAMPFVSAGVATGVGDLLNTASGRRDANLARVSGVVGGGVDLRVTDRVVLRGEALYTRSLDDDSAHLDAAGCCGLTRSGFSVRLGVATYLR